MSMSVDKHFEYNSGLQLYMEVEYIVDLVKYMVDLVEYMAHLVEDMPDLVDKIAVAYMAELLGGNSLSN